MREFLHLILDGLVKEQGQVLLSNIPIKVLVDNFEGVSRQQIGIVEPPLDGV